MRVHSLQKSTLERGNSVMGVCLASSWSTREASMAEEERVRRAARGEVRDPLVFFRLPPTLKQGSDILSLLC